MDKGIIAAPARVSGNGSSFRSEGGLTSRELRYFLLYWDKVVIPTTNIIHFAVPEEEVLVGTGIISRPRVQFSGSFNGETMAQAQVLAQTAVAKNLIENDRTTDWVLHQIGEAIIIPNKETVQKQTIRVDLINSLPVPDASIAIQDILEFKDRRRDELNHLHKSLDDFYFEILSSPDPSLKTKAIVAELSKSIANINTVSSERWKSTSKFDISAEININAKDVILTASAGAILDFYSNIFTIPMATLVGIAASIVKISCKATKSFEPAKDNRVLSYLAKAHEERLLN